MSAVLLLRGVNVGGHGKLPMASLREILARLGAREVEIYIQSGNAVMRDAPGAGEIAAAVEAAHGFRPACLVIPARDFRAAMAADPFAGARETPKLLHYFFCTGRPEADPAALEAALENGERARLIGPVLYFHAPNGLGRSKFPARAERLIGTSFTVRNFATVARLAAMLDGLP